MASYRSSLVARTILAVLVTGCGTKAETEPEPAPEAPFEPPSVESAWEMDLPALRDAVERTTNRAAGGAGTEAGVADAVRAAALCQVMSVRDPEGDWIEQARGQLMEAIRQRALPGACAASLELARLEGRGAGDPGAAYRAAFRASIRFATIDAECAAAAEAMLPTLAAWSPSASELAAIRANPDGDGPTAAEGDAESDPIAQWAAEHAGEAAQLQTLFVYGHETEGEAASVRVVLGFDRVVAYEHGEAPADSTRPRRTWLQLASVTPGEGVASELPVDAGGLTRVRVRSENGGTRVTFDLDGEARFRAFILPEPFRIVLDIELGGAHAEGPVETIVIDPGHGGDDFGARAFGLRESDLTLDIALRVRALLAARLPDVRVVLTRRDDTLVELEHRSALANAIGADLFLSIHLNGYEEQVDRGGVTTFVLDTSDDLQALRLAARENGTTVARVDSLARLLASMHRTEQVEASRAFAEQIQRATLAAGRRHLPRLHDRHVRNALFHVLVGARMPAVLLEASFLSQEEEAEALRTTEYRQALAEGIVEGIVRWAGS